MKRLILLAALLLCVLPARASISEAGACSASTTSCTLSATATGNVNIFWAYRSGSTTAPTLPTGYTSISSGATATGGTVGSFLLYCKVASSGSDTGSGTATNATAVAGVSYAGTQASATAPCGVQGVSLVTAANAKTSTTASFTTLTIENSNNWVVGFLGDSAGSTCFPASLTSRTATGDVAIGDTNATVSSFSTGTCTVSSSTWMSVTAELQGPTPTYSGAVLKRSWGFVGLSGNNPDTANNIFIRLEPAGTPRATASGDLILVSVSYPSALTPTISDSLSDTFTSATSCTGNRKYNVYWAIASGAATYVEVGFGSLQTNVQIAVAVFYNVPASAPVDVTACTAGIVPTTNGGSNIQSGSMTTTGANELIFNQVFADESTLGLSNKANAVGFGSGFTGLYSELMFGSAAQYQVKASAGAINSGMAYAQATHDTFASVAVAIKSGSGGSAPGSGISIVRSQMAYYNNLPSTSQPFSFPTSGNLRVFMNEAGTFSVVFSGVTSSDGATCTEIASTGTANPQLYHCDNTTAAANLTGTINLGTGTGSNLFAMYDIAGAATSPLDTAMAAAGTSSLTAAGSGGVQNLGTQVAAGDNEAPALCTTSTCDAPSLTPSVSGELILTGENHGTGPASGAITSVMDYPTATWNSGGGDQNAFMNGDGIAHYFASSTSTVHLGYTMSNTSISSWQALAAGFKAAPASAQQLPQISVIRP